MSGRCAIDERRFALGGLGFEDDDGRVAVDRGVEVSSAHLDGVGAGFLEVDAGFAPSTEGGSSVWEGEGEERRGADISAAVSSLILSKIL